ncbi:hypothetical protein VH79_26245, partial [Salmonella enterica]|nr:hypothetical protein [Salmonella enterica]
MSSYISRNTPTIPSLAPYATSSWVQQYFVTDVRLGTLVWVGPSGNGANASLTAPPGHFLTAILDGDT